MNEGAIVGRKIAIGINLEDTRGTAKDPSYFYPQLDFSFKDTIETKNNESAYGSIVKNNSIDVMSVKGEGSIGGKMFIKGLYYFLALAFGQKPTKGTVDDDNKAKKYNFALSNSNSHSSATLAIKNDIEAKKYTFAMLDSFKISWQADDYPKIEMNFISKKGERVAKNSIIAGYIDEPEFLPKDFYLKLADDLTGLATAPDVMPTSFSLEFKKNLNTDFYKGDVSEIFNMDFEASGSFEQKIQNTKYQDATVNGKSYALEFGLIDNRHKAGTKTPTSLKIRAAKIGISSYDPSYGLSDLATETINFEILNDIKTGKTIEAELINSFDY